MFASLLHRLQDLHRAGSVPSIHRRRMRMDPAELFDALPALGSVLYMPVCPRGQPPSALPGGVLVETMQLAPLLQTTTLDVVCAITTDGPREWADCRDARGRLCARLYLLPDTDYLAWDHLFGASPGVSPGDVPHAERQRHGACVALLRFHVRAMAGLRVLGAEIHPPASALSRQLAGQIARAEAVMLQRADPA